MSDTDVAEIPKLPVEDRMRLVELSWEGLAADPSALPAFYRRQVGWDLAGAFEWHGDRRAGLGRAFLGAVEASFDALQELPEMFARARGEVRRAVVS